MTSAVGQAPARQVPALFAALFDDAAIFPPGDAPLPEAVAAYLSRASRPDAGFVGAFLCSGARVDEFLGCLPREARIPVSLIESRQDALSSIVGKLMTDDRVSLRAVETAASGDHDVVRALLTFDRLLPASTRGYLEIPVRAAADLRALAGTPYFAKFRTGGLTRDAFPDERSLAEAIARAAADDVGFKLTAGLHNALRHRDPATGFEHHGFVNVLGAVSAAVSGKPSGEVERCLSERDPKTAARAVPQDDDEIRSARNSFVSFGTCSISEPLADLRAMGLLGDTTHEA